MNTWFCLLCMLYTHDDYMDIHFQTCTFICVDSPLSYKFSSFFLSPSPPILPHLLPLPLSYYIYMYVYILCTLFVFLSLPTLLLLLPPPSLSPSPLSLCLPLSLHLPLSLYLSPSPSYSLPLSSLPLSPSLSIFPPLPLSLPFPSPTPHPLSQVVKGTYDEHPVAVKLFRRSHRPDSLVQQYNSLREEVTVFSHLDHPR